VRELSRLGRRGSYRLGRLRVQGTDPPGPPPRRQPRFRRPRHQRVLQALAGLSPGRFLAPHAQVAGAEIPDAEALEAEILEAEVSAGGVLVAGGPLRNDVNGPLLL
jgi:hypothetical protein